MILTANPLKSSFLCKWLIESGRVDGETGFPVPEKDGVEFYMAQVSGQFVFTDTREEMREKYGKEIERYCQSVTFYQSNVYDNPYLRKYVPEYVSRLQNLPKIERDQLLHGNWLVSANEGGFIRRDMAEEIQMSDVPIQLLNQCARAWDLAGTRPQPEHPNIRMREPDYTASAKCAYDRDTGYFYIINTNSIRDEASIVEDLIHKTAEADSKACVQGLPIDPGAAGKESYQGKSARLAVKGYKVMGNKTRGSKLQRAQELILAFQQGRVKYVEGSISEFWWEQIEGFTGEKHGAFDDLVDALADCHRMLVHGIIQPITVNTEDKMVRRRWSRLSGRTLLK